ncbi:MAG: cytochrome c oxidase assembly protein [Gemmatimonadota bacterium]|nr:cytochrome c oxidase assembly protein [Gemmatimonadota bacterium]
MHPPVALLLHDAARIALGEFTVHPSTVIGLVALGALYHWRAGLGPLQPDGSTRAVPSSGQRATFFGALLLIFLSLNGWLHDLSDFYLFSAHMIQHLLLTLVAPPLLIMGTPGWMFRPALRSRVINGLARRVTTAPVCFGIFSVVLAVWHLPPVYETAMEHHNIHIVQHLCFMVAATLMWWPILSPLPELPRLSYPLQMLYLFLLSIPMSIVAICIGYSDHVLYPFYSASPRIWGITPLQDQLIGALIMWVPGGLFFFVIISVVFFKWQRAGGEDSSASAQMAF